MAATQWIVRTIQYLIRIVGYCIMKRERRTENFAVELDYMEKLFDVITRFEGAIMRCDETFARMEKRFEKCKMDKKESE